jgi:hypothetical protein
MADRMMVQVRLRQGTTERVCWIPAGLKLSPGFQITLKGEDGWWAITGLYNQVPADVLHTDWRVGGL